MDAGFLTREKFSYLYGAIRAKGFQWLGPRLQDGAIGFHPLNSFDELPWGMGDDQKPGHYRALAAGGSRAFAWANAAQSLKPLVFAPRESLWRVSRDTEGALSFVPEDAVMEPTAVIGVRACDLAGLALQDRHFLPAGYEDPHYRARREQLLLVAVNCTHPASTCFCASTGDGPEATSGYDLLLDELGDGYILRAGSVAGRVILAELELPAVQEPQWAAAQAASQQAVACQTRTLPAGNLFEPLMAQQDHYHWESVAEQCLSCGSCTSVCPSCFCHRHDTEPSLDGQESTQLRQWDSCFTEGHAFVHGRSLRGHTRLRYRQWLTHKLGGWHVQFGRSGCVGCGRCITWCPVGIDLTAVVQTLLEGADDE